jgi:hypothetical protein
MEGMGYIDFSLNTKLKGLRKMYLMFLERWAGCVKGIQSVVKRGVVSE